MEPKGGRKAGDDGRKRRNPVKGNAAVPLTAEDGHGNYIDLDEEFAWRRNLTDAQKLFVFHYCCQSSLRKNAAEAARKAGYAEKTAKTKASQLVHNAEILAEIRNIGAQMLKRLTKVNLESAVKDIIDRKRRRLDVNPLDYYDIRECTTEDGFAYTHAKPKLPEDMTEDQKEHIVDVEFVGQRGLLHYRLADKVQAENELLKIWKDFAGTEDSGDGFDVESTAEIISGKVQLKTKVIRANRETAEMSDLAGFGAAERKEED